MNNLQVGYIIVSFFSCLATFLVLTKFYQRYLILSSNKLREYDAQLAQKLDEIRSGKMEIKEQKEAIRSLFYQLQHSGPRPMAASGLGAAGLYWNKRGEQRDIHVLLGRPNHHLMADQAMALGTELDDYVRIMHKKLQEIHTFTLEPVKKFEALQDD